MEQLCSECAITKRLKVVNPSHSSQIPQPIQSFLLSTEDDRHSVKDVYLYDSTLSGRNIRFLQLQQSFGDGKLQCSLVVRPLDTDVTYHALSYAWGDPTVRKTIFCGGKPLEITRSLYSALLQCQKDGQAQMLWADAVCINQMSK